MAHARNRCGWLQVGDMDALDAIFVAIGGGGLIAGIASYVKALKPNIKVRHEPVVSP